MKRKENSEEQTSWNEAVGLCEHIDIKKRLVWMLFCYLLSFLIFWLFYRSFLSFVLAIPLMLVLFGQVKRKIIGKQKNMLRSRFLDLLQNFLSALEAGDSPEGAVYSALQNLRVMYKENDPIISELSEILRKMYSNRSLEDALTEFARKTKDEDIIRFANVFSITKRSGGDMIGILRSTINTISEKEEVAREINTLISAKRMEASIMAFMPLFIILYFQLVDQSFLMPLYNGVTGKGLMTVLLFAYAGCVCLILKITDIKF